MRARHVAHRESGKPIILLSEQGPLSLQPFLPAFAIQYRLCHVPSSISPPPPLSDALAVCNINQHAPFPDRCSGMVEFGKRQSKWPYNTLKHTHHCAVTVAQSTHWIWTQLINECFKQLHSSESGIIQPVCHGIDATYVFPCKECQKSVAAVLLTFAYHTDKRIQWISENVNGWVARHPVVAWSVHDSCEK